MRQWIVAVCVILLFLGTSSRILSVQGVVVNFVLLVPILGIILACEEKYSRTERLVYGVGGVVLPIIFFPFWIKEVVIAVIVAACLGLLFHYLTGNEYFDLVICSVGGTLIFYSLLKFIGEPFPTIGSIIGESIANGVVLLLAHEAIKRYIEPETLFRS